MIWGRSLFAVWSKVAVWFIFKCYIWIQINGLGREGHGSKSMIQRRRKDPLWRRVGGCKLQRVCTLSAERAWPNRPLNQLSPVCPPTQEKNSHFYSARSCSADSTLHLRDLPPLIEGQTGSRQWLDTHWGNVNDEYDSNCPISMQEACLIIHDSQAS